MEEEMAIIEAIILEEAKLNGELVDDGETGWTTVKSKPSRRNHINKRKISLEFIRANGVSVVTVEGSSDTVRDPAERVRRVVEEQRVAFEIAAFGTRSSYRSSEVGDYKGKGKQVIDDSDGAELIVEAENAGDFKGTKKMNKNRLAKISVVEAAAQIDAEHLAAYLKDASSRYEFQEDIQLERFADYFRRAFASVCSDEFPWMKLLQESFVAKMIDIPLADLPVSVYKTSADWINGRSTTAVGTFILGLWDDILAEQDNSQTTAQGVKQVVQEKPSKSQVAALMILALTLRRKPDAVLSLLPILKGSPKYDGNDILPLIAWVITQASEGDLAVGLHMWVQILLPVLVHKSSPQSRDLILQVVERIMSFPEAQEILVKGAVIKGERIVPPSALEVLMRLSFPPPEARTKETARFEAIYPIFKCIALAKSPGRKGIKQLSEQIFNIAIKTAGIPNLSEHATYLAMWCLSVNPACYKLWENLYLDYPQASIALMNELEPTWKMVPGDQSTDFLGKKLTNFIKKNKNALASKDYSPRHLPPRHHQWLGIVMTVSVILGIFLAIFSILTRPRQEA